MGIDLREPDPRAVVLTVSEAAERLRTNHMTVRRRIAKGLIKAVNIAEQGASRPTLRIRECDLAEYLKACRLH